MRRQTLVQERRKRRALLDPAWSWQRLDFSELIARLGPPDLIFGKVDHGALFYRCDWIHPGRWGAYGFMLIVDRGVITSIGTNVSAYVFHRWPTWRVWQERLHAPRFRAI